VSVFVKIERGDFAMKKKFSVEQAVGVLKQAEVGVPVAELIRKMDQRADILPVEEAARRT